MLWRNKGHEFDDFFKKWRLDDQYFVWGTSTIGDSFSRKFEKIININAYIDNNEKRQSELFHNKKIYSLSEVKDLIGENKIIVASGAYTEIRDQLEKAGFKEKKDFCDSRIFEGVYFIQKENKVYLYRTDISITPRCNLRCKNCNMFMPYYKNPCHRSFEDVKQDIDTYFKWVDNLHIFNILGGEPFLHPDIYKIIEYVCKNYYEKIEKIELFSNGTVRLKEELLLLLKKYNISIQISDYSNKIEALKQKIQLFIKDLEKYDVKYRRNINNEWLNFGIPSMIRNNKTDEKMIEFFDKCRADFRGISNGKFYFCHLNASAVNANLYKEDKDDYFDMREFNKDRKVEFLEYDLGYNTKGYLEYCRHCNGCFSVNNIYVDAAKQLKK